MVLITDDRWKKEFDKASKQYETQTAGRNQQLETKRETKTELDDRLMPTLHQKHFLTHNSIEVGWSLATIQQIVSRNTQQPLEKKKGEKESKYACVCVCFWVTESTFHFNPYFLSPLHHLCHILSCYTLSFPLKISLFTTLKTKNNPSLLFWFKSLIQWFYFKGCIHLLWSECFEDRHIFVAVPLWTLHSYLE